MKKLLAAMLRLWAERLDPTPPEVSTDPFIEAAIPLMAHQDTIAGRSGEAKRHQVLAALMDRFPEARTRDLAFAIELAIRGR